MWSAIDEYLEINRLLPSILVNGKIKMLGLIDNQAIIPNFTFLQLNQRQVILSNCYRDEVYDLKIHFELYIFNCRV